MKMKNYYHKISMLGLLLMALVSFSSCMDDDDRVGYNIQGHWFGDMDMYYNGERARGSELEFDSGWGWGNKSGTGVEVDYYMYRAITNRFDWRVQNQIIYLTFSDPQLDCAIVDYTLGYDYFRGYIADYNTLENQTYFTLRNYDRYWDEYGYGGYYVKGTRAATDSIAADSIGDYRGIRGINMKPDAQ